MVARPGGSVTGVTRWCNACAYDANALLCADDPSPLPAQSSKVQSTIVWMLHVRPDRLPASRQLVGAGLFIPNKTPEQLGIADSGAADATPHDDQHANGTLLYINPSGEDPTNTITRAESAAIHGAAVWHKHSH